MGINECSKPASKSSWDSQDFGDVNMVLKMVHFRKSSRPQWVNHVLNERDVNLIHVQYHLLICHVSYLLNFVWVGVGG